MSITPEAIRLLADKGLSAHDIAEIAEALAPARSAAAERQARYRQRKKANASDDDNERNVTRNVTPPNDIYSNPPVSPPLANANGSPGFPERFVSAWNAQAGLKPARKLTGQRLAKLRRRLGEFGEETLLEAVGKLGRSSFHCGQNDREWIADIGWFLRSDDNVTKALELIDRKPPVAAGNGLVASILAKQQRAEGAAA